VLESREMRPEMGIVEVRSSVGQQSSNNKRKSRCDRRSRPIGKGCNPKRVFLKNEEDPVNTLLGYTLMMIDKSIIETRIRLNQT